MLERKQLKARRAVTYYTAIVALSAGSALQFLYSIDAFSTCKWITALKRGLEMLKIFRREIYETFLW